MRSIIRKTGFRIPSYLCCNRLVRRQLFDTWKIRFREGVICEDIPLILKLEAVAANIQTIGDGEYYYRANPQSTTSTIKNPETGDAAAAFRRAAGCHHILYR